MFGIGETELVLIVLFAFMIFGPDKLPGMGRTLGRALRQFKSAQEGFTEVVQTNIMDPAAEALSDTPKKPNRNRAAELEDDADLEDAEGEEAPRPKRTETFAERKKRLAEEKAARQAAEAEREAAAEAAQDNSDAAADEDAPAQPASDAADEPQPKKPSAADLYAMGTSAAIKRAGGDAGVSPSATHEASEERSDERGATGADPSDPAGASDDEKEA